MAAESATRIPRFVVMDARAIVTQVDVASLSDDGPAYEFSSGREFKRRKPDYAGFSADEYDFEGGEG